MPDKPDRPAWWTQNDEANLRCATAGCRRPDFNCINCSTKPCPDNLRTCRTCANWDSDRGIGGRCRPYAEAKNSADMCPMWRGRGLAGAA